MAPPAEGHSVSLPFQCYKSSKDHSPQLDVSLRGSSVTHKEKQVRKKEHKLKITPLNADVIVLGLQSRDQAEQWLRVRAAPGCRGHTPAPLRGSRGLLSSGPWLFLQGMTVVKGQGFPALHILRAPVF